MFWQTTVDIVENWMKDDNQNGDDDFPSSTEDYVGRWKGLTNFKTLQTYKKCTSDILYNAVLYWKLLKDLLSTVGKKK